MNDERFSIECDEGECTIWYKKPYLVDISKEAQYVIVMEIGYKRENSADEYYFTKDEAVAMAKKICAELERSDGFNGCNGCNGFNDATDATG